MRNQQTPATASLRAADQTSLEILRNDGGGVGRSPEELGLGPLWSSSPLSGGFLLVTHPSKRLENELFLSSFLQDWS